MKNLLVRNIAVIGAFIFAISGTVIGFAQNQTDIDVSDRQPQVTDQQRADRTATRQAEIDVRIDEARAVRIAERCEAAQQKIATHVLNAAEVRANRERIYASMQEKLTTISDRLLAAGQDTEVLNGYIAALDLLVNDFFTNFSVYQQALDDAASLDCAADPEAFLLALEDARLQLQNLKLASTNIRTYVTDTLVVEIDSLKSLLTQEGDV